MVADRILILGASARAAAASARRAGMTPFAVDLFADADTERLCEKVWRCPPDRYPDGLFELAKLAPPMPWMYTGGLENYPELVGELARERELWGNGPEVLRRVRDPFRQADDLAGVGPGVCCPQVRSAAPRRGGWVRKPMRGSGGTGIRPAAPKNDAGADDGHYFQQFVEGRPMSAAFASSPASCELLGVTDQLVGTGWLHAGGFGYAGNVGPHTGRAVRDLLDDVGRRLTRSVGVRGLWGLDFVLTDNGIAVIEVNPRYPASVEILEHSLVFMSFDWLRWAVAGEQEWFSNATFLKRAVGKAIYYAPCRVTFPASGPWDDSLARAADVWHRPDFADLPHPGDVIEPGQPVLTVLAEAATEDDCLAQLRSRAADLDRLFGFVTSPQGGR